LVYPTVEKTERILSGAQLDGAMDIAVGMIAAAIESIYDKENVYPAIDSTPQELVDFIDSLNKQQFDKIQTFFENFPKLKQEVDFTCEKCNKQNHIVLEGLNDFFV